MVAMTGRTIERVTVGATSWSSVAEGPLESSPTYGLILVLLLGLVKAKLMKLRTKLRMLKRMTNRMRSKKTLKRMKPMSTLKRMKPMRMLKRMKPMRTLNRMKLMILKRLLRRRWRRRMKKTETNTMA